MDPTIERAVAAYARDQDGLVTRAQLQAAGMTPSTVWRRVATGALVTVGTRTYRLASAPRSRNGDLRAVCLDLGATPSHWTATWQHGLVPFRPRLDVIVGRRRSVWPPPASMSASTRPPTCPLPMSCSSMASPRRVWLAP